MYSHVASYPEHPFDTGTLIHTVVYIRHNDTLVRNCLDGTVHSEPCTKLYRVEVRVGGWTGSCRGLPSVCKRKRRRATWPWPPRMACCQSMEGLSHRVTPPRYARPPHVEAVRSSGWLEQVGRWAGRARHEDGHEAPSCACGAADGPRCLGHNVARRALGGEEGDDETAGHERGAMWPSAWVRRAGEREVGEGRRRRLRTVGDSQLVERCAGQLAFFLRGARGCKDGYRW